jgi:flagellar motor switch protein FliN
MMSNVVNRIELPPLLEAETGERSSVVGERLDLVGHVKVRLAVTLGTAELTIDKLFSLAANDVVSLDRDLEAPVDVRLNDKVIARGTLVAVGDNFGVRITEISRET